MHEIAEKKRDLLIRNMLILDALVLLLLFGKSITIPGLNVSINDIPAAREVITFFASLTFQFAALAFLNWHGYAAIIDIINVHKFRDSAVDSDFLSSADKFMEFFVKLYRARMNFRGIDFAKPGKLFTITGRVVTFMLMTSVASFLLLHLTVVFISARESVATMTSGFLLYIYILFLFFVNVCGLMIWVTTNREFHFTIALPIPEATKPAGTQPPLDTTPEEWTHS